MDVVSTDIFDTILLRDASRQQQRFFETAVAASAILSVDAMVLADLRQDMHDNAYRAVSVDGPRHDARLTAICNTMAVALGLDSSAADVLRDTEIAVDIRHLSPNRKLLDILNDLSRSGKRIIAVSDTWYSAEDLHRMMVGVVGPNPISHIYSSADLGVTKHTGGVFAEVEIREQVAAGRVLHVGDNWHADVEMPRAAGWTAIYLRREGRARQAQKALVASFSTVTKRMRAAPGSNGR